jgi:hypothetical protein
MKIVRTERLQISAFTLWAVVVGLPDWEPVSAWAMVTARGWGRVMGLESGWARRSGWAPASA